ncbi:MAG: filamentous hemagglutinin family protein [Aquabacterium sp.]|uniref:filamentous haemagglutinin family protein n=1 Tax=Aquabacterium sp. TaxID=1872578 RepID=UPI0025C36556|nr:filamentous haemagglutinin family protein [Aquabacterium sp.]MBI3383832.1 filamentous hemagglutinin family protein [Aquabacterium sp.]
MNKHIHRLVFDRKRGMRVPAAESVRAAGKAAGGQTRARAVAGVTLVSMALSGVADARDVTPSTNRSIVDTMMRASTFNIARNTGPVWSAARDAGKASQFKVTNPDGLTTQIDQYDSRVIINWDSFNVGADYSVLFNQPKGGSAYNRIWDLNPTVIMGKITANGEVILENTHGVIFGATARVQTGRFVTTALKMTEEAITKGLRANRDGQVMFGGDDADPTGFITIERGAEVKALAGGDVLMIAPKVYNEGTIETPKGQTVLAAGQKVYLYSSLDPAQRGLLVAVDPFASGPAGVNTVENAAAAEYRTVDGKTVDNSTPDSTAGLAKQVNQIVAEQGSINLVGLTVRNNGILTATTAVKGQNGAIYLQAQKTTTTFNGTPLTGDSGAAPRMAAQLGTVELGSGSVTQITPSTAQVYNEDTKKFEAPTQTDAETFNQSRIEISGASIRVQGGAQVVAPYGKISLLASEDASKSALFGFNEIGKDNSAIVIEDGALVSAAGLRDVLLPMSRNQLNGRLFANELADSPVQRGGVLYRSEVSADARSLVKVANVSGFYNLVGRTAEEIATKAGTVKIQAQGSTVVADGAKVDVSGGSVVYQAGTINSSLLRKGNTLVKLEDAQAGVKYDELISGTGRGTSAQLASYVEGKDGGEIQLFAPQFYIGEGTLKGDVVVGPYQRGGPISSSVDLAKRPDLYASLRPLGARLTLGFSEDLALAMDGVTVAGARSGTLGPVAGVDATAVTQLVSASLMRNQLTTDTLSKGGFAGLSVYATALNVAKDARLDLGPTGSFSANKAKQIQIDGQIKAAGGSVSLSAIGDVVLGEGAAIDVSGSKLDELGQATGTVPVDVNGGAVALKAGGSVRLSERSQIDVSAGAWRASTGGITTGKAGSLALEANVDQTQSLPGTVVLNGRLSGYDFQSGGKLSIKGAPGLSIGQGGKADDLQLTAAFFSDNGFGSFELSSLGDVDVVAGTVLTPRLKNYQLDAARVGSGNGAALFITTEVNDAQRAPVNLTLTAIKPNQDNRQGYKEGGRVRIGAGAQLDLGAGGRFAALAGRQIVLGQEASITAHGGSVAMTLTGRRGSNQAEDKNSADVIGYVADNEVRLSAGSRIDVSGVARTQTQVVSGQERVTGTVLGGGTVSLNYNPTDEESGQRGRVITEAATDKLAASLIDVSGQSAQLNLGRGSRRTTVSQGAGSVKVGGADGFALMGDIHAQAPDASVGGGEFIASVSREGKSDATFNPSKYPSADRVVRVTATQSEVATHADAYGEGVVSAQQLADAGFDRISLRADDRVVLDKGASIGTSEGQKLRAIIVSAPVLKAEDGGAHELRASYVALGDVNLVSKFGTTKDSRPASAAGNATLAVNAGLIELHGKSAFQGWQSVDLNATLDKSFGDTRRDGEIRFIGRTFDNNSTDLIGYLGFDGVLTLRAGQSYATTLSKVTVQGALGHATLKTEQPSAGSSTSATPLTALASLTLQADDIAHNGVLRQPFGALTLNAVNKVTLGAGSTLSVSGDGVTVPVGTTVNERSWVYTPNPSDSTITTPLVQNLDGLPVAKGIQVKGQGISLSNTSIVQAQAGGDLQAWEFIRGVGGSTDTLNRANLFAVLPNYQYDFAPYDTEIAKSTALSGTSLQAGDKITISTANGVLAKGTYTLLPSRYALLPGAVLVSAANVGAGGTLNQAITQDDGSVFVSGQRTATGTSTTGGDPRQTFMLESAATFRAKSAYALTSINSLLTDRAVQLDTLLPSLAGDAGRVSLEAKGAFDLLGQFNLAGKGSLAAGQLDVVMPSMTVADDGDTQVQIEAGSARVSAQSLNGTHAGSIMLGGVRTGTVEGATATVSSSQVRLASSSLSAGEVIAVATDTVTVDDGVKLTAEGAVGNKANQLTIKGQGAAVVVSQNSNTDIRRDLSGVTVNKGTLNIGQATLSGQAVQLDASQSLNLNAHATINSKLFGLGAPRIVVGGAADTAGAVALDGVLLNSLKGADSMQLRSYSSIDFKGALAFDARGADGKPVLRKVVLDAPQLRGLGQSADTVSVTAQSVILRNTSGIVPSATETGTSALAIQAEPVLSDKVTGGITIGEGAQRLAFANSTLTSKGDIVFDGKGQLGVQGDVTLAAARVTATSTADHGVDSAATLTITSAANARTLNERVGAGGALTLSGERVVQDGVVDVASGKINIIGKGNTTQRRDTVTLTERSVTKAAGWTQQAGKSWSVDAPGGDVTVQAVQGDLIWRGQIDVSAPVASTKPEQGQAAGTVTLLANGFNPTDGYRGQLVVGTNASLKGSAGSDRLSASLSVDAQRLSNEQTPGLSDAAQAAAITHGTLDRLAEITKAGGVRREVDWRIREGAQSLNTELTAQRVFISADAGSLQLGQSQTLLANGQLATHTGTIDARAPQGGVVQLAAGQDLIIGANVLADSSRVGANGGDILLASAEGQVRIQDGVTLSAGGDDEQDGRVVIRALRTDDGNLPDELRVNVDAIGPNTKVKAGEFTVEAVRVYTGTKLTTGASTGTTLGQLSLMADNDDFMVSKDSIASAMGLGRFANAHLRSGVEIQSSGNFEVSKDWNLWSEERAGGEPLNLTIRAAGDLNIKGSLSDGFATATRIGTGDSLPTEVKAGPAASFRLVAGADLSAANVLKTDAKTSNGNLRIDGGKMVRTTSGSIELAAAKDIELKAGTGASPVQAVVYVAGQRAELPAGQSYTAPNDWAQFTNHGGRVSLAAGGNIVAPAAAQLINNWFQHAGESEITGGSWYSFFDSFKQGVGSFGGGNIDVRAGQSINNLGVVAPTSMRQVTDDVTAERTQVVDNGGDIHVHAGQDIKGGVYFLGRGDALIQAGGAITKGDSLKSGVPQVGAVVGLMDGHVALQATKGATIAAVYNPTALPSSNRTGDLGGSYFTYGADAGVSITSTSGDVNWTPEGDGFKDYLNQLNKIAGQDQLPTQYVTNYPLTMIAPPSLAVSALSGDVVFSTPVTNMVMTLFPSSQGQLDLFAGRDLKMNARLVMADGDPSLWPTLSTAVDASQSDSAWATNFLKAFQSYRVGGMAVLTAPGSGLPSSTLHQNDATVAHIHAERDIGGAATGFTGTSFNLPKAAEITAGRDIIGLTYVGQQYHDGDVTRIEAGRNILGKNTGSFTAGLGGSSGLIALAGPGELQVKAGRQLDLGDAGGVRTVGNKYNTELSADSAKITLAAGMAKTLDADTFVQRFLPAGDAARADLVVYVQQVLKLSDADLPADPAAAYEQALSYYKAFTREHQLAFADAVVNKAFIQAYLASGSDYALAWQAKAKGMGVSDTAYDSTAFAQFKADVVMNELKVWGKAAADVALSLDPAANALANAQRQALYDKAFAAIDLAGLGKGFHFVGDIQIAGSGVQTQGKGDLNTGGIDIFAPGGGVLVGLNALTKAQQDQAKDHGLVTYGGGSIRAMSAGDFLVNAQKTFVVGNGDIMLWSSYGSLDAGRGANTDVTVPPPVAVRNADGSVSFELPPLTTGSGIGRLTSSEGASQGQVYLNAPNGEIRALDAQIRNEGGGQINIGAQVVKGGDNIAGKVNGAPPAVSVNVAINVNTSVPSQTAAGAQAAASSQDGKPKDPASVVTVDLLGMGDDANAPAAGNTAPAAGTEACEDDDKKKDKAKACTKR